MYQPRESAWFVRRDMTIRSERCGFVAKVGWDGCCGVIGRTSTSTTDAFGVILIVIGGAALILGRGPREVAAMCW